MSSHIEDIALNALYTVIREHIGVEFETDDTLQHETKHYRNSNQLFVSLHGKGELSALVTVNEHGTLTEVSVLLLNYRRPNHTSWHYPNTHFKVKS